MFETIHSVPWSELKAFNETAADVPALLWAAASRDAVESAIGLGRLHATVYRRTVRCEATPHLIPFLFELLRTPSTHHRATILDIVARYVAGPCTFREGISSYDGERVLVGGLDVPKSTVDAGTLAIWRACYDEARKHVAYVLTLVDSGSQEYGSREMRRAAAMSLATLHAERGAIVPRLAANYGKEPDAQVRACYVFAIGMVSLRHPDRVESFLWSALMEDTALLVRVVAAMTFVWTQGRASAHVVEQLAHGVRTAEHGLNFEYGGLPFGMEGIAADIGHVLRRLPRSRVQSTLLSFIHALESARGVGLLGVVEGVLRAAVDDAPVESNNPSPRLRAAQAALLYSDEVWRTPAIGPLLEHYGLPTDRTALGNAIGLSYVHRGYGTVVLEEGLWHAREQRFEEALDAFRRAAKLLPHQAPPAMHVVATLRRLKRHEEGLEACELAISIFERESTLHFDKGRFLLALGDYVRAADACEHGVGLLDTPAGRYTRACAYARLGRKGDAMIDLREAIENDRALAAQAKDDEHLTSLREDPTFQVMTEPPRAHS